MSLQLSDAIRNAMIAALESAVGLSPVLKIRTGLPPENCASGDTGNAIVTYTLGADWLGSSFDGAAIFNDLPIIANADITSVWIDDGGWHFRLYASGGGTCHMQGLVTPVGGNGDLTINKATITASKSVQILSATIGDQNQ